MRLPFSTVDLEKFILEKLDSLGLSVSNPWVEISQHMGAYLSVTITPIDRGPNMFEKNDWDYEEIKEEYMHRNEERLYKLEDIVSRFLSSNNIDSEIKYLNIGFEERGDINAELYFEIIPNKGKSNE